MWPTGMWRRKLEARVVELLLFLCKRKLWNSTTSSSTWVLIWVPYLKHYKAHFEYFFRKNRSCSRFKSLSTANWSLPEQRDSNHIFRDKFYLTKVEGRVLLVETVDGIAAPTSLTGRCSRTSQVSFEVPHTRRTNAQSARVYSAGHHVALAYASGTEMRTWPPQNLTFHCMPVLFLRSESSEVASRLSIKCVV